MTTLSIETPYNMGTQNITVLNPDVKNFYNRCFYIGVGHYRNVERIVYANCLQEALDEVIDFMETQEPNNSGWFMSDDELLELSDNERDELIYGGNHCRYLSFGMEELLVREI